MHLTKVSSSASALKEAGEREASHISSRGLTETSRDRPDLVEEGGEFRGKGNTQIFHFQKKDSSTN